MNCRANDSISPRVAGFASLESQLFALASLITWVFQANSTCSVLREEMGRKRQAHNQECASKGAEHSSPLDNRSSRFTISRLTAIAVTGAEETPFGTPVAEAGAGPMRR